jgi:segregation and condensation protein B
MRVVPRARVASTKTGRTSFAAQKKQKVVAVIDAEVGRADGQASVDAATGETLSVSEAALLLGRDRTRVYALLRSGDLATASAAVDDVGDAPGPVRIARSSVERWLVAGGGRGGPLAPRNAWAVVGLASGDQAFSERCVGLLDRPEEVSRTRARLAREKLVDLAPRLRRRATLLVRHLPSAMRQVLEHDAVLVRTGVSAASAYGWDELLELSRDPAWMLDAYLPVDAFSKLQDELNRNDINDMDAMRDTPREQPVLLRVVDEPWPFPPHYQLAPQPLAALDLLDYPDPMPRRVGRRVLETLSEVAPTVLARRSARARAKYGPLLGRLLSKAEERRGPKPVVEGDPRTDSRAAAAHVVGVLWVSGSQGMTSRELRGAIGLSRERLEAAYEFLLEQPPLGLSVQRHGEDFSLVTAPEVAKSIERHLGNPRPVTLSRAALEVLAIVAYRQPVARAGIELIRGSASDSALDTLLDRGLIERNAHQLLVTTRAFLDHAGLRDLADLLPLSNALDEGTGRASLISGRMISAEA